MKTTRYFWKHPDAGHFSFEYSTEPGRAGELQLRPDERLLWSSAPGSTVLRWGGWRGGRGGTDFLHNFYTSIPELC